VTEIDEKALREKVVIRVTGVKTDEHPTPLYEVIECDLDGLPRIYIRCTYHKKCPTCYTCYGDRLPNDRVDDGPRADHFTTPEKAVEAYVRRRKRQLKEAQEAVGRCLGLLDDAMFFRARAEYNGFEVRKRGDK
jgi:hypothetical protein